MLKSRLQQRGESLLIRAELIDARDGAVLWRDQYSRSLAELLGVEDEISRGVAEGLGLRLGPVDLAAGKQGTQDSEAYRLYLQGRYYWDQRGEGLRRARQSFQESVDRDPSFALAWAGMGDAFLMLGGWHLMPPADAGPRAEAAAKRAIELDPLLAQPHATLGYLKTLWEWDWPGAEREFRQAIELNPEYGTAHHWFAFYWLTIGNVPEALAEIERAGTLSPLSPVINAEVAYFYSFARQYDRAERAAAKAVELNPEYPSLQRILCRIYALQDKRTESRGRNREIPAVFGAGIGPHDGRGGGAWAGWKNREGTTVDRGGLRAGWGGQRPRRLGRAGLREPRGAGSRIRVLRQGDRGPLDRRLVVEGSDVGRDSFRPAVRRTVWAFGAGAVASNAWVQGRSDLSLGQHRQMSSRG